MAVANCIKAQHADASILFIGALGKMEMSKVPEAGYEIIGLNIAGLKRRLTLENLLFPLKVISSFMASLRIIKSFKPDVVVGFGGYASSPITMAAARKRVPVVLQEQNSYAGLANKSVAKRAARICVAYQGMEQFFPADKIILTGNPVRSAISGVKSERLAGIKAFNLDPDRKTILVIGGSLGAKTLNESMMAHLDEIKQSGYQLLWQCGSYYYENLTKRLADTEAPKVHLLEFIKAMDLAYAAADLVISRAGALTISELCLVGKPVIFVPSPNVAEDHQTKNAEALVTQGAGMIVSDAEARTTLLSTAFEVLADSARAKLMADNISAMAKPNAAEDITNEVLSLVL